MKIIRKGLQLEGQPRAGDLVLAGGSNLRWFRVLADIPRDGGLTLDRDTEYSRAELEAIRAPWGPQGMGA